ncbi:MAG TPA: HD domain-containing protein [Candidatus Limnocylindrales bacterium]|nr:HD domain-containing protein [Candidatus Limnocylindrales bacterium]
MDQSQYRTALVEFIELNAKPPDKFSHQARLYAVATRLAEDAAYDDDVVYAAAWLHDLGVFVGHRPEESHKLAHWDHIAYAIEKSPGILRQCGFPIDKIPAVLEAIRTHLPSANPTIFEGSLLRDADILEQLGAVGILRIVSKVGRDTRFIRFSDALRVLQMNLEELPGLLKLDSARRLAQPRVEALKQFLAAAQSEANQVPW